MNKRLSLHAVVLVLSTLLLPVAALAAPVATVASCEGIKAAYPVFAERCKKNYAKIEHQPANAAERLQTYNARVEVLKVFRQVLLCNGLRGASAQAQENFKRGEPGHLEALANLYQSMQGDRNRPAALYTATDLAAITVKLAQCN